MAKGEELNFLIENSKIAIETWTAKEAVQKSEKLGMHLNPRDINLVEYNVESFIHDEREVVAWTKDCGSGFHPRPLSHPCVVYHPLSW